MRVLKRAFVRLLLLKSFVRALARQLHIKLTKFTRRSAGISGYYYKLVAGCDFLRQMSRYNWDVIQRSRRCLNRLTAENVCQVFVYGERDVREVLYDLTIEIPLKLTTIQEPFQSDEKFTRVTVPVEITTAGQEKIIVASLVNVEERVKRLTEWGVSAERIILLADA